MPSGDILQQFLDEPGGHLVMDTDLRIVEVGPEFARLTKSRRDDLIGKQFLNIITDPDHKRHFEATEEMRTAIATANKTRHTHKMPVMRIDIVDSGTHKPEERWWRPAITPVLQDDKVSCFVLRLEDVTTQERSFRMNIATRRLSYVLCGILALMAVVLSFAFTQFLSRTSNISSRTCEIQKTGIRGNVLLSNIMGDISGIIENSAKPIQPVPPKVVMFAIRLENDLTLYRTLIHNLPKHRNCV